MPEEIPPPSDIRAEASLIGNVLYDEARFPELASVLRPEHFHSGGHQRIYEALIALRAQDRPITIETTHEELQRAGRLAQVGGLATLTELVAGTAVLIPRIFAEHARIVLDKWRLRQVGLVATRVAAEAMSGAGEPGAILAAAASDLAKLQPPAPTETALLFGSDLAEPLPAIAWLCQGLKLTSGALTVAAGNAYSGKSLAA